MIKKITNFDGYFISSEGKVFCNLGKGNRRNGVTTDLYEIKPRLSKNGYTRIYARESSSNKRKDLYIHRLVALYFLPNPKNKKYVNHKDCNRANNNVNNLEWCTAKENTSQTMALNHLIRNEKGQYVGNFDYIVNPYKV